jgi:hypothetical protein
MRVFVSYSHDSPDHMDRVLGLCNRLRADGVDGVIDQYEISPAQGWPRWTHAQIENAKYVLVVCTETYARRFNGIEPTGKGLGAKWEGAVITQSLYDAEAGNDKFIPILFSAHDAPHIPTVLRGVTNYDVTTDAGYWRLYRRLTNQPEVAKPLLGELKPLPPLERQQEFIPLSGGDSAGRTYGRGGEPNEQEARDSRRKSPKKLHLLLLTLPTVLVGIAVLVLLNWRIPTHIRAELTARKVVFMLGGSDRSPIINSLGLKSISIEKFNLVRFKPESLSVFSLLSEPIVIKSKDERFQSSVSFTATPGGPPNPFTMGDVMAEPSSEVTLEMTEDGYDLIMRIDGQHSSGNISVAGPFTVGIDQCEVSGIVESSSVDAFINVLAKLQRDTSIEFDGRPDSLLLTMTVPPERAAGLFPRGNIPVTAIRFEQQSEQNGAVISSLSKVGELSYPSYEKIGKRSFAATDFVSIGGLSRFSIEEVKLDPEAKGIVLTLQGVADKVTTGTPDFKVDQRLTAYDAVSNNHQVLVLFAIVCWVSGTSVGAYKLLKGGAE